MSGLIAADDLHSGYLIRLGEMTLSEDEIVDFASAWDPQWFHTDPAAAATGHHGGVIASGIHTLAVLQKLSVEAFYSRAAVIAGRGFDRLRFTAPVRPGDTLRGSVTVTEVSLDETRGRVGMDIEMHDQDARTVLTATMTVFLWRRGHGGAAGGWRRGHGGAAGG